MRQRGYSLLELPIVVATTSVHMAAALPRFQDAPLCASMSSLSTTAGFDAGTFGPLVGLGYDCGRVASRLDSNEADGYLGTQNEFWLEMMLDVDPSVRFLVADSQNAPLRGGQYLDGVFLYVDGVPREIGTTN